MEILYPCYLFTYLPGNYRSKLTVEPEGYYILLRVFKEFIDCCVIECC